MTRGQKRPTGGKSAFVLLCCSSLGLGLSAPVHGQTVSAASSVEQPRPAPPSAAALPASHGTGAQTTPTPPAKATTAPAPSASSQASPGNPPAQPQDTALGALPAVADPMLQPPAPAKHVLTSWQQALRLVRSRSTSLAQAQAQVASAAAQARLTVTGLYPKVTLTSNLRRDLLFNTSTNLPFNLAQTFGIGASTIWTGSLQIQQPLLAPKVWYDKETAEISQRAATLKAEDAERLVLASVADTIVSAITAERLAEISRVSLESSLATLNLTRRRAKLGAGSAVDVLRAEQEVTLNRAQVVSANEALERSREALGMALGYAEPWAVTPNVKLDQLARDAHAVCSPIESVTARSDIRSQKAQVRVAERNQHSNDWLLSPSLDAYTQLSYSDAPFTSNGRPAQWLIGASLSVPLYDGGARYAQTGLAHAQVETARANLTQAERQAQVELRQARRAVEVAEKNFAVSRRSREISAETARLARLSFINGRATSFELVDADRRFQEAELDLAVKEFDLVRARVLALLANANCDL